jgi:hypothetical protein
MAFNLITISRMTSLLVIALTVILQVAVRPIVIMLNDCTPASRMTLKRIIATMVSNVLLIVIGS